MAEKSVTAMEVFWTNYDDSEIEDPLVYVKGLTHSGDGNRRPKKVTQTSGKAQHKALQEDTKKNTKIETYHQNRPTKTVKNPKTLVNEISQKEATCPQEPSVSHKKKKVTLKDLGPEDKKRVANLIQELARIGEEKENIVEQLYSQRHEYDQYIHNLLDQQEMIVSEREKVMKQLYDCQVMLSKYQKIMTEHQEKRNEKKASRKQEDSAFEFKPKSMPIAKHDSEFEFNPKPLPITPESFQNDRKITTPDRNFNEKDSNIAHAEVTPGGTKRRTRVPPAESGSRPFTNMIDQLIEQEKSSIASPASSYRPSTINSVSSKSPSNTEKVAMKGQKNTSSDIAKGKLFGIGPLPAPILSSTHTSDLASNATNSPKVQHNSRTKAREFGPMAVDTTETLSLHSDIVASENKKENGEPSNGDGFRTPTKSKHDRLMAEKEALIKEQQKLREIIAEQQRYVNAPLQIEVPPLVNKDASDEHKVKFHSPVYHEMSESSDHDMVKYYSQLSPGTRQKELSSQKEALLLEQQRLKEILGEQERLLKTKQEQLHHQQELQRHRLEFFRETGYFPPSQDMDTLYSAASGDVGTSDVPQGTFSTMTNNGSDQYSNSSHDAQPAVEFYSENVGANFVRNGADHVMETRSEEISPMIDMCEIEDRLLSESMENLRRLTRPGVAVPDRGLLAGKKTLTGQENRRPLVSSTSRELLDRSQFMLKSRDKSISPRHSDRLSLPREPLQSLADIIDEVESLQSQRNSSHGDGDARFVHCASDVLNNAAVSGILNASGKLAEETTGSSHTVLEESQLLEEVFFVHKQAIRHSLLIR